MRGRCLAGRPAAGETELAAEVGAVLCRPGLRGVGSCGQVQEGYRTARARNRQGCALMKMREGENRQQQRNTPGEAGNQPGPFRVHQPPHVRPSIPCLPALLSRQEGCSGATIHRSAVLLCSQLRGGVLPGRFPGQAIGKEIAGRYSFLVCSASLLRREAMRFAPPWAGVRITIYTCNRCEDPGRPGALLAGASSLLAGTPFSNLWLREGLLRCSLPPEKNPAFEPKHGKRRAAALLAESPGSFAYLDRRVVTRAYVLSVTSVAEATR